MSRPVRGKCMCTCFVFIAIIYCLFEGEIWEFSVKMLPWGKALCMCSVEEDELFFPLCVTAGCCLLLPLNSKFICRNTATIGTSSHSFCFSEYLLPLSGYWLFPDSHLNMSVGYLNLSWMGFIPAVEGHFPCECHEQDRWHKCGLVHTHTYPNATKAILDNLWLKINK